MIKIDKDLIDLIPEYLSTKKQEVDGIRQALEGLDFEQIRIFGHSLKGSGGGYGFDDLSQIGAELEKAALEKNAQRIQAGLSRLEEFLSQVEYTIEEET